MLTAEEGAPPMRLTVEDDAPPSPLTADPAALDAFDAVLLGVDDVLAEDSTLDLSVEQVTSDGSVSGGQLTEAFDRLGVAPENGVYVGRTDGDTVAAVEAGTSVLHVDQLRSAR